MKNQQVYVTEVFQDNKTNASEKESEPSIVTANDTKAFMQTKNSKMSPAKYLKTHTVEFDKTKESFLEYIINDQTKFADFNRIEDHYKESIIGGIRKMNDNKKALSDKLERLNKLNQSIEQTVISTLKADQTYIEDHYHSKILKVNLEIDKQALQLEMYTNNKKNLEYDNFTLKNKLDKITTLSEVYTKQIQNYQLIYDRALGTMRKDLDKADKLSDYNGLTKIKFDNNIEKKKREFHDLEVQIFNIKQNSLDNQAHLEELKKNIELANEAVKEQNRRNFHMFNHNSSLNKEFLRGNLNVVRLFSKLDVYNLDEVVRIFKNEMLKYDGLFFLFNFLNKTIADKQIKYTDFEKKLEEIREKIKIKDNRLDSEKPDNLVTFNAQKTDSDLKQTKEENEAIADLVVKTEQNLKEVFLYVKRFDKSLDTVMSHINNFVDVSTREKVEYDDYIEIKEVQNFNVNDVRKIVNFILAFHWKVYYCYCTFMTRILYNTEKPENSDQNEVLPIYLFNNEYNEKKKKILSDIQKAFVIKNNKSKKTESEVFSQQKSGESLKKKKKIDKHFLKTTLNTIYDAYFTVNKKEENSQNLEVLYQTKNKMMNNMVKFTNNLVYDDLNNKALPKKIKPIVIKDRTSGSNKKIKSTDSNKNNIMKQMTNNVQFNGKGYEEDYSDDNDEDNSYESAKDNLDDKLRQQQENAKSVKNLNTDNEENFTIFRRKWDIHTLTLNYFKETESKEVTGERVSDLKLKLKKDDFFKKVKYKEKSNRLARFISQYNKGKASVMLNIQLENGKKKGLNTANTSMTQQNRTLHIKTSLNPLKPTNTFTTTQVVNEISTNTNYNYRGTEIKENKEIKENFKDVSKETTKSGKLAPVKFNHRKTQSQSNWGDEVRQQIPDLLRQIRRNSLMTEV